MCELRRHITIDPAISFIAFVELTIKDCSVDKLVDSAHEDLTTKLKCLWRYSIFPSRIVVLELCKVVETSELLAGLASHSN